MPGFVALLGRILLAAIFVFSGVNKIVSFDQTQGYVAQHDLPLPVAATLLAIAVEVFGGLSILVGARARLGAWLLVLFLIPTTYVFHLQPGEDIHVLKNLAIMGGLLLVAAFGPGPMSVDGKSRSRTPATPLA